MSTCVRKEKLGSVGRIFLQNVVIVECEHVLLGQIEDGRTDKDGFVEEEWSFWHVDECQILVDDLEFFKVWFRDETFRLFRVRRKFNVRSQSDVLDRFSVYLKNNNFARQATAGITKFVRQVSAKLTKFYKSYSKYDAVKKFKRIRRC